MKPRWKLISGEAAKRVEKRAEKKKRETEAQRQLGSAPWEHLLSLQSKFLLFCFCFFFGMQKSVDAQLATVSPLGSLGCLKALDCLIASHTESQLHLLVVHPG